MTEEQLLAASLVVKFLSVGVFISSIEWLYASHPLRPEGLISWDVASVRNRITAHPFFGKVMDLCFGYPQVKVLILLRAFIALIVIASPLELSVHPIALSILTGLVFLSWIRHPYGNDGAEQMIVICLVALTMSRLAGSEIAMSAGIWFVAFQSCLSYATAGITKMTASKWWDGSYLAGVFTTRIYGHPGVANLLKRSPLLARSASISLLLWEASFPLVLVMPISIGYGFLAIGLIFHMINARYMGLNLFLWAFPGSYPAILYCITTRGW